MKINIKAFLTVIILIFSSSLLYAQSSQKDTTPAPYTDEEFPQALKDIRRFEIITLGSMPFVTLDAALVYNGYKYFSGKTDTFNPLATADYKPEEMKKIIITSLCVSAGIGLSDYIIRLIKRKSAQKKSKEENKGIKIEEDPDAIRIALPSEKQEPEQ